ncbi:terminase small subunit [Paenibacillus sp. FSL R7-0048]|uniref:terminase small subunit n=1 Tax=Paenibacillus TaxID=44249 RepID=UPI00096DE484|nr:terminase small subunit [Paenibacillus odorifer]OMD73347.1 terminase small subunit [Paenibacillus odorifer]
MKLTDKQQKFVDEYLIDLNATQAAIRAGYSVKTAKEIGAENLSKPHIRARIDERLAVLSRRTGINQERIMRELARIAFLNAPDVVNFSDATIRDDASEDDTAAIASVKVKTIPGQDSDGVEREIKFADKIKALELLGKRYGMWVDKQITGEIGVQIIDDIGSDDD